MVEYSILVGIIAVAAILVILAIGGWVIRRFTDLCAALEASPVGTCNERRASEPDALKPRALTA
ncbi:hypothetical protein NKH36_03335 [Mesorhizobium sp. M1312]|uniref:Flp family type IVb pilin n=1 Tax=unclassified Mesorhizobium TaxID=325217 RepID=UPI00333521C0